MADGGKRLQAIAAHLPFYDIDPGRVRMLGTGQWDEPGIGAVPALVGGWFAAPTPQARADFEKQYAEVYGRGRRAWRPWPMTPPHWRPFWPAPRAAPVSTSRR